MSSAEHTRRDFLYIATGAVGAVGAAAALVPLIAQMNPDASTIAAGAPIEVDLAPDRRGPDHQGVLALQADLHLPPHARRRSRRRKKVNVDSLPDPEPDSARVKDGHEQWLVVIGICTHLGCIPLAAPGQLRRLVLPVPRLAIRHRRPHPAGPGAEKSALPPYAFVSDTKIRIG